MGILKQIVPDPRPSSLFSGDASPVSAMDLASELGCSEEKSDPRAVLARALERARGRGRVFQDRLLADPTMLSVTDMAARLGVSEEDVRHRRERHEILGLDFAGRGIRYPQWQVLPNREMLPVLPRLFEILGDDPWRLFKFLLQYHAELGGGRAIDALRRRRVNGVLAAAENTASGAFS